MFCQRGDHEKWFNIEKCLPEGDVPKEPFSICDCMGEDVIKGSVYGTDRKKESGAVNR
jgi:hypothetical protein